MSVRFSVFSGRQAVVEGLLKQCFSGGAPGSVTKDPLLAMAGESGETRCKRLELSDGSKVYLRSVWETMNFSIVVFDGVRAWSRSGMEASTSDHVISLLFPPCFVTCVSPVLVPISFIFYSFNLLQAIRGDLQFCGSMEI